MKNTFTLLNKVLCNCIPKGLITLTIILGFTLTSYAQVPDCDSVNYEMSGLQPDSLIMVCNGHPSGTVMSWDWTITSVNTQTVIYTSNTGPYLFVPPLLYSQNEAYEVCLVTVNQINNNIITCIQCDIVSWDSLANSWVITPAPNCNVTVTSTNASNSNTNDGTATATPDSSGTPPYTYVWNTGEITPTIDSLAVGTYCVTVVDANNCSATGCTTVGSNANTTCSISVTSTDVTCGLCTDGTASASVSGGTPPYTYLWNTGVYTSTIDSLAVGTYCVTVTDADTCTVTGCVTVGSNTGTCMASFYPYIDSTQANLVYLIENSVGSGLSYYWDFDDGTTSTQQFPTHVYNSYGTFNICLTVSDSLNCINTSCITMTLDSIQKTFFGYTVIVVPEEPATGILEGSENNITENVLIYPNPSSGLIHIKGLEGNVFLYDSYGREVLRSRTNNLNIQKLPKGVYFIRIFGESGKVFSQKVLKE